MSATPPLVSNEEKAAVWAAYRAGKPTRVPVTIATNARVILLDPRHNPEGYTFEQYFNDPALMLEIQLRHARWRATVLHRYTDDPVGLPDVWRVSVDRQNVYEAAYLGSPVEFRAGQVPDAVPWLMEANKEAVFERDITRPTEVGFFADSLRLCEQMMELARGMELDGRPVEVIRYAPTGTDGPLTVGASLRGAAMLADLLGDPDYATRLMAFITEAAVIRVRELRRYWNDETLGVGLADDSIQLISTRTYRDMVMPHHRRFYDTYLPDKPRGIHLCGDSTRHFRSLRDELNVQTFDTGFPVDFTWLRQELGPGVEILGGPPVSLLLQGTPKQVSARCREILGSGITEGGRFILREGNNLPPLVPEANLEAMYRAALDWGRY